ncbi:hypothetical protein [Reticulibacter mediterranei]|nr:hypothetical protein [Reticulibacter mediterranei]
MYRLFGESCGKGEYSMIADLTVLSRYREQQMRYDHAYEIM